MVKSADLQKAISRSQIFVDNTCKILDGYGTSQGNVLVLGDCNMEVNSKEVRQLLEMYQLNSLYKGSTYFQTTVGRSIDVMLTSKKH